MPTLAPPQLPTQWRGRVGVVLLLLILLGQWPLRTAPWSWLICVPTVVGVLGLLWLAAPAGAQLLERNGEAPTGPPAGHGSARWQVGGGALVLVGGALLLIGLRYRQNGAPFGDLVALWIGVMMGVVLVGGVGRLAPCGALLGAVLRSRESWIVGGLLLTAMLLRVVDLEHTPRHVHGDEGVFAFAALDTLSGRLTDPFTTGWTSNPTLVYFLQGAMMGVVGDTVAGVRLLMALGGTVGVLATYAWLRVMFGPATGLVGGILLAGYDAHLYFSRTALRHAWDSVWVPLALLCLYLGVVRGYRAGFVFAGLAGGLAQYWYFGARVLPVAVAVLGVYVGTVHRGRLPAGWSAAGLVFAGLSAALLPLGAHYAQNPHTFVERIATVTGGTYFSAPETARRTGATLLEVYGESLAVTALALHRVPPQPPFYPSGHPLLDPLSGTFVLAGVVVCVACWRELRAAALLVPLALVVGLVSLTEHAPQAQRLFTGVSALIGLVAVGIVAAARLMAAALGWPASRQGYLAVGPALVIAGIGIWMLFGDYLQSGRDATGNSEVATELGYYLRAQPPPVTYYFFADPRMSTTTHPSLPFIARGARGIDVPLPPAEPPRFEVGTGRTVFVFLPHRVDEIERVRALLPGPPATDYVNARGVVLFSVFRPDASP